MNIRGKERNLYLVIIILTVSSSLGLQGWRTLLNNFAVDKAGINGEWMGVLQSIREIPGLLCLLVVYVLYLAREQKLVIHASVLLGIGVAVTGLFPSKLGLIFTIFVMSVGFHVFETTRQSLVLQSFDKNESTLVLGKLRSYSAATNIIIGISIVFLSFYLNYKVMFLIIGGLVVVISIIAYFVKTPKELGIEQHKKIVIKRKYWLFYVLNFLSGARRQIFVVFSIFLLVKHYGFSIWMISALFVINNIINFFAAPYVARKIINIGEKRVLLFGYSCITLIFLAYAVFEIAWVAALLYVFDNFFFNINIGIKTYFKKHAENADIASSMATGFTINHLTAVIFPLLGGWLWMYSFRLPFILGAGIALTSVFFCFFMKRETLPEKKTKFYIAA
jgi:hypothetical protein